MARDRCRARSRGVVAKIEGLDRLKRRFAQIPPHVRSAIRQAMAQGADEIVAFQKRLAPVSPRGTHGHAPGALRDSIVQTWGGVGGPKFASLRVGTGSERAAGDLSVTITAGNSGVRYAHLVEFGTAPHPQGGKFTGTDHPGTAPQPFFYPPYRALRRRVKARISRAMKRAIKQSGKR